MKQTEDQFHDHFYQHESKKLFGTPMFRKVRSRIFDLLRRESCRTSDAQVLSLGSGDGDYEIQLANSFDRITGIEISEQGVEQARNLARSVGVNNVFFEVGNICELNQAPNSVDTIWMNGLLHHIEDEKIVALLRDCHSWLKPDGCVISIDPSAQRFIALFKSWFKKDYEKYHSPDERELLLEDILRKYSAAGFTQLRVHYSDYFFGPLAWLFPGIPKFLVPVLASLDSMLLHIPVVNRFASSFTIIAKR